MTEEVIANEAMTTEEYTQEIIEEASRMVPKNADLVSVGSVGMILIEEYLAG